MAKTIFNSGQITANGTFILQNCGFYTWAEAEVSCLGGPNIFLPPGGAQHHLPAHFARNFTLGPVSVSVEATDSTYSYASGGPWTLDYGPEVPGYPGGLPSPSQCGWAIVRAIWVTVNSAGVSDTALQAAYVLYWSKDAPCGSISMAPPWGNLAYSAENGSLTIDWSISLDPLYLSYTRGENEAALGDYFSYAVHPDMLEVNVLWFANPWEVSGICGNASSVNPESSYNSVYHPTWSASFTYGTGFQHHMALPCEVCGEEILLGGRDFNRMGDTQGITWTLDGRYPGLRDSDSEEDTEYATYTYSNSGISGTVESGPGTTSACVAGDSGGTWSHSEWGRCWSRVDANLKAYNVETLIQDTEGLKANVTYFRDRIEGEEITWEIQDLSVSGIHSISAASTSRYTDQIITGPITAGLTFNSLGSLKYPTGDYKFQINYWGLDKVTNPDEEDGPVYTGAVLAYRQSPLNMLMPNDTAVSTEWLSFASAEDDDSYGVRAWEDWAEARTSDNQYAVGSPYLGQPTHYLKLTNIVSPTLPETAILSGIEIRVEANSNQEGISSIDKVRLVLGGVVQEEVTEGNTPVAIADTWYPFGSSTSMWGLELTREDVISEDFGVAVSMAVSEDGPLVGIDSVQVKLWYYISPPSTFTFNEADFTYSLDLATGLFDITFTGESAAIATKQIIHFYDEIWANKNKLYSDGEFPPSGATYAEAMTYLFNFEETYKKFKHVLAGFTWNATVPMVESGDDLIVDWANGEPQLISLQRDEDIYSYENYSFVRLRYRWYSLGEVQPEISTVTFRVTSDTVLITDSHQTRVDYRKEAFELTRGGSSTYTYTFEIEPTDPEDEEDIKSSYIDFFSVGDVRHQLVDQIVVELEGVEDQVFELKGLHLIGLNPETKSESGGKVETWRHYPRRKCWGDNPRKSEEYTGIWHYADGRRAVMPPDDELIDCGLGEEGVEYCNRVVSELAEKDVDRLFSFSLEEIFGIAGQEGMYGDTHVSVDPVDTAMQPFVDGDGVTFMPSYRTDFLEGRETFYDEDHGAQQVDGEYAPRYCIRCGQVTLAEGMCWAHYIDEINGYPIEILFPKYLKSPRVGISYYRQGSQYYRAGSGNEFRLYEQEVTDPPVHSLIDAMTTSYHSWLWWEKGIHEYRHDESGDETSPDWTGRNDWKSDVLAPEEVDPDDLAFGRHHYQGVPAWVSTTTTSVGSLPCLGSSTLQIRGFGWGLAAMPKDLDDSIPSLNLYWCDTPNKGIAHGISYPGTGIIVGTVSNGRRPKWIRFADGSIGLSYIYAEDHSDPTGEADGVYLVFFDTPDRIDNRASTDDDHTYSSYSPVENLTPLEGGTMLFQGYTCYDIHYLSKEGVIYFVGYKDANMHFIRGLLKHDDEVSFDFDEAITIAGASEYAPSIELMTTKGIMVFFVNRDGDNVSYLSTDGGLTWESV